MTLADAFSLEEREVISLVGGGGKTSLLFALGKELSFKKKGILLTTTTKIREPVPSPSFGLFVSDRLSEVREWITRNFDRFPFLVVAQRRLPDGKLGGIDPQWVRELSSLPELKMIVIEADGAAGRSLKAPRDNEPVIAENTSLLIPVVGIDALGRPLNEEHVFRSEIAARLLKVEIGSEVNEEVITRLVGEIIKGKPGQAKVVPCINKVDLPNGLEKAKTLARHLLRKGSPQIKRVVLGQVRHSPPVREILTPC